MKPLAALILLAGPALADGPAVPQFLDETASSGVTSAYQGGWEHMGRFTSIALPLPTTARFCHPGTHRV